MKKQLSLFTMWIFSIILIAPTKAQKFGYAGEYAMPRGKFIEHANPGYGITTFYTFPVSHSIEINTRTGLILWPKKPDNSLSFSALPIVMGLQYYLSPGIFRPLLLFEAGVFFMRTGAVVVENQYGDSVHTLYQLEKGVAWGAGLQINTPEGIITFSARKQNITGDFSNLVLRFGIVFD